MGDEKMEHGLKGLDTDFQTSLIPHPSFLFPHPSF